MNIAQHALKQLKGGGVNLGAMMTKEKPRHGPSKQTILDNLGGIKSDIKNGLVPREIARKYNVGRSTLMAHLPKLLTIAQLEVLRLNGVRNAEISARKNGTRARKAKVQNLP